MNIVVSELVSAVAQVVGFAIIPFIWWLITARKKENFFKWIGLKSAKPNGKVFVAILIMAITLVIHAGGSMFLVNKFAGDVTNAGSNFAGLGLKYLPVAFIYGFIRTGMSEEIIFRGFILKRLQNKFGFVAANIMQAIAFGLIHGIPFGLATHNIGVTIILTILPGLMGFVMGWLNEKKFSGSIIPSWLVHSIVNTITTIIAL